MNTTREQDSFVEGMAASFGGVRVLHMAPSTQPTAPTPDGAVDVVAVPWVDGRQVAAPVFVPHDVGYLRLARAATASEVARAQEWARRVGSAGAPEACDALSLPTVVGQG